MFKLLAVQWCVLLILTLAAYFFGGVYYALSLFLGGAVYAIPSALAVILLTRQNFQAARTAWVLFGTTLLKLVLLVSVFLIWPDVHFLSLFFGLLAVSHLVFLIFLKVYRYGRYGR